MKIVFCLPGKVFSGTFIKCWTNLLNSCLQQGIDVVLSQKYSSNVYFVRAQCLGADLSRGINQKPFDGKLKYDYLMWIDSDQVFHPNHFFRLLSHQKDIVGGLYLMEGGKQFAVVKDWDVEYLRTHSSFKFLEPNDIVNKKELLEVSYTGFGFLLIKYGVFENISYPWFEPQITKIGDIVDFASEDVSFCLKAKNAGYKIYVDPTIIIGHEKTQIF